MLQILHQIAATARLFEASTPVSSSPVRTEMPVSSRPGARAANNRAALRRSASSARPRLKSLRKIGS